VENYVVDPLNQAGLEAVFVRNILALNINKWENAAGKNIFGSESAGSVDGADTFSPDGKNEIQFGDIHRCRHHWRHHRLGYFYRTTKKS